MNKLAISEKLCDDRKKEKIALIVRKQFVTKDILTVHITAKHSKPGMKLKELTIYLQTTSKLEKKKLLSLS